MVTDAVKGAIRKFAVKNAHDFGKADVGAVLGKVVPLAKGVSAAELREDVASVVAEVNRMKKADLEKAYAPYAEEFEKKAAETVKRTEKPNMELPGAETGSFVTRWPPEPSGYQHIGHAKPIFLEDEFRKIYKGKFILYFDDTNPEKEKQEYVDADKADLEWLGIKFDNERYASDGIEKVYEYAKKLVEGGNAYVCNCGQEAMKDMRAKGEECGHRKRRPAENAKEFERMLSGGYKEGEATLRFKGDMRSQNTVMRDPVIARIKEDGHYRQGAKYRVWPTYDLSTPINDSLNGVTDVLRSKEYELRDELDVKILKLLGLRVPRIHEIARLNIKGNTTHKREIRELINKGKVGGWDDPRLMTFLGLKRRGIVPEAIRQFALKAGNTKADSELPLEALLAENRKAVDPYAKHLYFVANPVKVTVKGNAALTSMSLHPAKEMGRREYRTGEAIYIDGEDAKGVKIGDTLRLKDLADIKVTGRTEERITAEISGTASRGRVIQWVDEGNYVKCKVLVPGDLLDKEGNLNPDSLKTVEGYVETYAKNLEEREIVQFERFGYCILDSKKGMTFILTSK